MGMWAGQDAIYTGADDQQAFCCFGMRIAEFNDRVQKHLDIMEDFS